MALPARLPLASAARVLLAPLVLAPSLAAAGVVELDAALGDHDATVYYDPAFADLGGSYSTIVTGDLNGDGAVDVVIGRDEAEVEGDEVRGMVVVLYGPFPDGERDLVSRPPDVRIVGEAPWDRLGQTIAVLDVNGDRIDDLAVAATGADRPGHMTSGAAYVFFGRDALPSYLDLSVDSADVTVRGVEDLQLDDIGGGDIDGDGLGDLVLSGHIKRGIAGVLYGRPSWPARIDLLVDSFDTEFHKVGAGGWEPPLHRAYVRDLDGDGAGDVLLADGYIDGRSSDLRGHLLVWFGGFRFPAVVDRDTWPPDVDVVGPWESAYTGHMFDVGDFNGDRLPDLAVRSSKFMSDHARVDLILGRPVWPAVIDLAGGTSDLSFVFTGADPRRGGDQFQSLSFGDFDGDGLADLASSVGGTYGPGGSRPECGRAFIWFGQAGVAGEFEADAYPRTLALWGEDPDDRLGEAAQSLTDIDGDGLADLLTANRWGDGPDEDRGPNGPGEAYLVRGCEWAVCCDLWRDASLTSIAPLDRPWEELLPLDPDDCYRWRHSSAAIDPDPVLFHDASRPLVFYASPRATVNSLRVTRSPGDRISIRY